MSAVGFDSKHLGVNTVFVDSTADAGGVNFKRWDVSVGIVATIHGPLVVVFSSFIKVDNFQGGDLGV